MSRNHRGTRSEKSASRREQRKAARDAMYEHSFQDRVNGDVVNLLRPEQVVDYLSRRFEGVLVDVVPCAAIRGCVLTDPYGAGAFQK